MTTVPSRSRDGAARLCELLLCHPLPMTGAARRQRGGPPMPVADGDAEMRTGAGSGLRLGCSPASRQPRDRAAVRARAYCTFTALPGTVWGNRRV